MPIRGSDRMPGTGLALGTLFDKDLNTSNIITTDVTIRNSLILEKTDERKYTITWTQPTGSDRALTIPAMGADDQFTFNAATQTLTNKTITVLGLDAAASDLTIFNGIGANNLTIGASGTTVVVQGDLTVNGDTTTVNTATLSVEDPLILAGNGNGADSVDLGLIAKYTSSGVKYRGLFWDANVSAWSFFTGTEEDISTASTINISATGYALAPVKMAALTASSATIDDITIDGSTISDSGVLTVDIGGNIDLDTGGTEILLSSAGTQYGRIGVNHSDLSGGIILESTVSDKDVRIRGNDGGSMIDALHFDMSSNGGATFYGGIYATDRGSSAATFRSSADSGDLFKIDVTTHGATTLTTIDDDAAAANLQITADGTVDIDSAGVLTLDSGAAINIEPASGSAILLDGTISIDAGVVTGATSITSTAFVGDITGDVTGTADVATVATTVTITDNESTNEDNAIIFTAGGDVDGGNIGLESDGTLTYNPSTGKITATGFIGALTGAVTGDVTGTADVATVATTVTITDNESTDEDNAIIFTAGGDVDGGNIGLESDGTLTYNPSTGKVTATGFVGTLTGNVTGNTSGSAATVTTAAQSAITSLGTLTTLTVDDLIINGTNIGHTSDTDSIAIASDGVVTFSQNVALSGSALLDSTPADGSVSGITGTFTAGEDLEDGECVYLKASDGKMWKAVSGAGGTGLITSEIMCVAMCASDVSADAAGTFLLQGFIRANTNFPTYAIGETLYLPEAETSGKNVPEGAKPDSDGDFIQVVGWAVTGDSIFFNPSYTIIEHA